MDDLDFDNSATQKKMKVKKRKASEESSPAKSRNPKPANNDKVPVKQKPETPCKKPAANRTKQAKKEAKSEKQNQKAAEGIFAELVELSAQHRDLMPPDTMEGQPIRALDVLLARFSDAC